MDTRSLPRNGVKTPPSTRELVADEAFCGVLAEDLGLKPSTVRTGLINEPKVRCIRLVEWLLRNAPDDADRRARLLIWWAKKRRAGAFREPAGDDSSLAGISETEDERFGRLAEALAAMWVEHPESLAEAIKALEQARAGNGRS